MSLLSKQSLDIAGRPSCSPPLPLSETVHISGNAPLFLVSNFFYLMLQVGIDSKCQKIFAVPADVDSRVDHFSESRMRTTSDSLWPRMTASCFPS